MGVLDNIARSVSNLFGGAKLRNINNPFNQSFFFGTGSGLGSTYDNNRNNYIKKGYNINPIVYAVISQQATKTASIPYSIKKIEDKQSFKKYQMIENATKGNATTQQKIKMLLLKNKAFQKGDIPLPMEKPNVNQTWSEFISLYKTFIRLTGNAFIYMLRVEEGPEAGKPMQVYLLPSQHVRIVLKNNANLLTTENPIKEYILDYGNVAQTFPADDVIHIKFSNPDYDESGSHLYGISPLRSVLKNIESSNIGLDLNIKTLKSGGAFGFIHGKNRVLTPQQAQELKDRLLEMNNSPEDLSKIAGSSAEIGFTRLSLTSDELKPFDYFKFDTKQICNVLGWSDKLLNNDEGAKYDNMGYARRMVITDNIQPDLKLFCEAMNKRFLPLFKDYKGTILEFDIMELPEMQEDIKELVKWLNDALDRGVITRNEYRVAINYTKSEDKLMEIFTVNGQTMSLEDSLDSGFGLTEQNI